VGAELAGLAARQELKEHYRGLFLALGGLGGDGGDLLAALLLGSVERGEDVLLGLGSFKALHILTLREFIVAGDW